MKYVYIAIFSTFDEHRIDGVYSTLEAAIADNPLPKDGEWEDTAEGGKCFSTWNEWRSIERYEVHEIKA